MVSQEPITPLHQVIKSEFTHIQGQATDVTHNTCSWNHIYMTQIYMTRQNIVFHESFPLFFFGEKTLT